VSLGGVWDLSASVVGLSGDRVGEVDSEMINAGSSVCGASGVAVEQWE